MSSHATDRYRRSSRHDQDTLEHAPPVPHPDPSDPRTRYQEITPTSPTLPPKDFADRDGTTGSSVHTRPRPPPREVTPPSPPSSFLLHDPETTAVRTPPTTATVGPTPPASIKQRLTRVFRARGISDASSSTGRHRKQGSSSTNATVNRLVHTESECSSFAELERRGSVPGEEGRGPRYRDMPPKRLVMDGGEVRVAVRRGSHTRQHDGDEKDRSSKYYEYYTRSNSPASPHRAEFEDVTFTEDMPDFDLDDSEEDLMSPPLAPATTGLVAVEQPQRPVSGAVQGDFSGFQFGLSPALPEPAVPDEHAFAGLPPTRPVPSRDPASSGGDSGKASSTALPRNDSFPASGRSLSSLSKTHPSRSNSRHAARPGYSRNPSNNSFNRSPTSPDGSDEVARELKRLSKISAGSGVSAVSMAIVVTTDGPADTQLSEDAGEGGRRWTREEKGKQRAESSIIPSRSSHRRRRESVHSHPPANTGRDSSSTPGSGEREGHTRTTPSPDNSTTTTTTTTSDAVAEIPEFSEIVQTRKLPNQEAPKDVLVHQGDPAYDFTYRLRHTPFSDPIMIPSYRYHPGSSFPNRNALTRPLPRQTPAPSTPSFNPDSPTAPRVPPSLILRDSIPLSPLSPPSIPQSDGVNERSFLDIPDSNTPRPFSRESRDSERAAAPSPCFDQYAGTFLAVATDPDGASSQITRPSPSQRPSAAPSERSSQRLSFTHLPTPAPPKRRSWSPARWMPQRRASQFARRSLTPHLYNPQDINLQYLDKEAGGWEEEQERRAREARQKRIGRLLILGCLCFPPLLFILAGGAFDKIVEEVTEGEVRGVGRTEKRLALVMGAVMAIAVVVAVVVGVSVAVTR